MPLLWYLLNDADCIKLLVYQHTNYPDNQLEPPGIDKGIHPHYLTSVIENLPEIEYIIRQPPGPRWGAE